MSLRAATIIAIYVFCAGDALTQYSGVDNCAVGPCANATPCRHCTGSWSGNLGDTWSLTSDLNYLTVSGSGTIPNSAPGCPAWAFQVSSTSYISPTGGSYPSTPGTTNLVLHATPSLGQTPCGGFSPTDVTINVQIRNDGCDIAAGTAQNDDGSFYYAYYSMAKPADLPTGETTTGVGWSGGAVATMQQFRQTLQGAAGRPFDGRQVTEAAGADKSDTCYYPGAAAAGYSQFGITGAWWIVGRWATPPNYFYSNVWIDDYVGMTTDLVTFYRNNGRAPCDAYAQQLMNICTNGQGCPFTPQYRSDYTTYHIDATTVMAGRDGVYVSRYWP